MLKKLVCTSLFFIVIMFSMTSCYYIFGKTVTDSEKYDVIYSVPDNGVKIDTVLGSGGYTYESYLILFPKERPENIEDFYYYVRPGIDYDTHCICFTYTLEKEYFKSVAEEMKNFSVTYNGITNTVIYDETHFDYPAVILAWPNEDFGKCKPAEYILLDYDNCRMINVFKICAFFSDFDGHTPVNVLPKCIEGIIPKDMVNYCEDAFSIYSFTHDVWDVYIPPLEELEYTSPYTSASFK